jgi:hypothetical protein
VLMDMPRLTVNDTQAERTQPKESTEWTSVVRGRKSGVFAFLVVYS